MLVHVLLADEAVAADGQAVVGSEDDERVVALARVVERFEDAADLLVEMRDDGVVAGEFLPHVVFGARKWQQQLVATTQIAMVEGMLWAKVRGQGQLGRVVFLLVSGRPNSRVVRGGEIDVNEKRLVAFLLDQADRRIGEVAADVGREAETFFGKRWPSSV